MIPFPWLTLVGAVAVTYLSRFAGAMIAERVNVSSPLFSWLVCITYGLMGALCARMVLLPQNPLADVNPLYRVAALAGGIVAVLFFRGSVLVGLFVGMVLITLPLL